MYKGITQTINGKQIRDKSIEDRHISGRLSEDVIDINWHDKEIYWSEILKKKIVIFYREYEDRCSFKAENNKSTIILRYPYKCNELPSISPEKPIIIQDVTGMPLLDKYNSPVQIQIDDIVKIEQAKYKYEIQLKDSKDAPYIPKKDLSVILYVPIIDNMLNIQKDFSCVGYNNKMDSIFLFQLINNMAQSLYGQNYKKELLQPSKVTLEEKFKDKFTGNVPITKNLECPEIITEVFNARGKTKSLNARLSKSIGDDGLLLENRKIHYHVNLNLTMNNDMLIEFDKLMSSKVNSTLIKKDLDLLDIYVDGILISDNTYELIVSKLGYVTGIKFDKAYYKGNERINLKLTIYNKK